MRVELGGIRQNFRSRGRSFALSGVLCAAVIATGFGVGFLLAATLGAGRAAAQEPPTECAYVITAAGFSPTQPGTTCDQYQVGEVVYTEPCPTTGCPYQRNWAIYNGVCEYPAQLASPPCEAP